MSGLAEIVITPQTEVEVIVEGETPQPAQGSADVEVVIEAPGPPGPRGLPGASADIPDPGDLTLYFANGLT